jgi:hypothetical protein
MTHPTVTAIRALAETQAVRKPWQASQACTLKQAQRVAIIFDQVLDHPDREKRIAVLHAIFPVGLGGVVVGSTKDLSKAQASVLIECSLVNPNRLDTCLLELANIMELEAV